MISSNPFIDAALVIFIHKVIWYFIGQSKKNNGLIDIAWGLGFVWVVITNQVFHHDQINWILLIAVATWGFRLAGYLGNRNWSEEEDWRYQKMRKGWEDQAWWKAFVRVSMGQGLICFVMCLSFLHITDHLDKGLTIISGFGFSIWLAGFLWESIADYQLSHFKGNPDNEGDIITSGLWKYSRHPNYFGEIMLWWGIAIICLSSGGNIFVSFIGAIIITLLLNKVSGVPMLEKKMKKYPNYKEYMESTNALIPRF